jgi:hypothetical protein
MSLTNLNQPRSDLQNKTNVHDARRKGPTSEELYMVNNNVFSQFFISPISPNAKEWTNLKIIGFNDSGKGIQKGGTIKILTKGKLISFAKVCQIREHHYRCSMLLVFWYYTAEEARRIGCEGMRNWPTGKSHILSTHLQVIQLSMVEQATELDIKGCCVGKVLGWVDNKPEILDESHPSLAWTKEVSP